MNSNKIDQHEITEKEIKNPKKELVDMVKTYLDGNPVLRQNGKVSELEIRFGTNSKLSRPITKIDYENTVKKLYSSGFTPVISKGTQILRIQNEYVNPRTGMTQISNIRAEIVGIDLIQEYCKTNSIEKIMDTVSYIGYSKHKVKFTQKSPPLKSDRTPIRPVDFTDFNFRVSYQHEQDFNPTTGVAKNIISSWSDSKKLFRYINRVRFTHPELPLFADISIIKGNKKTGRVPVPEYTIQDAGVFDNIESYEIEFEVDNTRVGISTEYNTPDKIIKLIHKGVRIVLSALQGTNYPISYTERNDILQSYMKLLHGEEYQQRRVMNSDFIGPSSYTLQMENIVESTVDSVIPNIRKHYTVTDKADGERKLLYISGDGRMYMIDTNMNVIFTGTSTTEKTLFNSLLDGEHILYDKTGKYINLYAAFDMYYVNGKSVRELAFMKIEGEEEELDNKYRLLLLKKCMKLIKPVSVMDTGMKKAEEGASTTSNISCDFLIKNKEFYSDTENKSIFDWCSMLLSNIRDGIYQYNTDGLIFTPCNTAVGGNRVGTPSKLQKISWTRSFKWKPAEFNTIDFLVSVKKDKNGKDEVHNIFQEGRNMQGEQEVIQYKTLILRCGFNENVHGFLNPYQNLIDDVIPSMEGIDNEEKYKPVPFQPTNPHDPLACFCNIILHSNANGDLVMRTETKTSGEDVVQEKLEGGEYFEEDMIVEFRYDTSLKHGWRWIPIKVRYDKTAELRAGRSNYGNAYHVANSNWQTIHNPITEEMISTGKGIPELVDDEDVYYNRYGTESNTKGLRNFHNLFVKKRLISGVSDRKNSLIDFAVGKAGDLSKWRESKLGFVFGVDISKDNIHNNLDGACSRYLKDRKKYEIMPDALFAVGNSSLNIRSGEAFNTEKDKMVARAIFGNGPKDRTILGEGVYKNYGIAQTGFNISSCQFALHYFFENQTTFHNFIRNIAECTSMGGYFVGTCYDGKTVFNMLKNKNEGESIVIMKQGEKIYEVTKLYSETGFPDDEGSLGYPINVYQETINKVFREYLVNFDYFIQIMEDYGFVLVEKDIARKMGLPNGSGLFKELYDSMQNEITRNPEKESDYGDALKMSNEERRISFMNRYFVFKKMRTVNADKLAKVIINYEKQTDDAMDNYDDHHDSLKLVDKLLGKEEEKEEKIEEVTEKKVRKQAVKKIKKAKFVLDKFSPIQDTPPIAEEVVAPVIPQPQQVITIRRPKNTSKKATEKPEETEEKKEKAKKPRIKIIGKL